jgi:HPt (histidine-containing phosphotransfer) domain-containing protein
MIDLSFLKEITKNNDVLINEFLSDFLLEKTQFEIKIEKSIAEQDCQRVKEISHSFKSSAKIIGIAVLYQDLDLLERTACENDWLKTKIIVDRVFEILKISEKELIKLQNKEFS